MDVCADSRTVQEADRRFSGEIDTPALARSVVFGAAAVLFSDLLESEASEELVEQFDEYRRRIATLSYYSWLLRNDRQVLRHRLTAAKARVASLQRRQEILQDRDGEPGGNGG